MKRPLRSLIEPLYQLATWVSWAELLLGLALLRLAVKQFRGRPRGDEEAPTPKWMGAIDHFTPAKAAGAGVVLAAVNPKNFVLTLAEESRAFDWVRVLSRR